MFLYNRVSRQQLKEKLNNENFKRKTLSFYRYFLISDPQQYRDELYACWNRFNCFGRIYVAHEGINAQMSVPEHHMEEFRDQLNTIYGLKNMHIKYAVEDNGKSFYKLTIKVREKIVADGLDDNAYDVTNIGRHLTALQFHQYMDDPDTIVVDMRNHYEFEVGHFRKAFSPEANTFKDALKTSIQELQDKKNKRILLYCTGGIRCEKASAYFRHHGFTNVNQLHGGIIEYARKVKMLNLDSKFTGKNFVFDERLGESIDGKVIAKCHQCGNSCDNHTNCAHDDCHQLFIQCVECSHKFDGCCSEQCQYILHLPEEEKKKYRIIRHNHYSRSKIYTRIEKENGKSVERELKQEKNV